MTVNKNQVSLVINTAFHIFFSNSKNFQLIESQPTTNNARSAILGASGHGQALIKMQRISIKRPSIQIFSQKFFWWVWTEISIKCSFSYIGKERIGYNLYFACSGIFDKVLKCHFWKWKWKKSYFRISRIGEKNPLYSMLCLF